MGFGDWTCNCFLHHLKRMIRICRPKNFFCRQMFCFALCAGDSPGYSSCLSSLALSTCVVHSPNGLRFARLCRPTASIRIRTFWRRRSSGGKVARSRRSDFVAPLALKTRSFFWPNPLRQNLWLRTEASPTATSLPLLTRENPPLRATPTPPLPRSSI